MSDQIAVATKVRFDMSHEETGYFIRGVGVVTEGPNWIGFYTVDMDPELTQTSNPQDLMEDGLFYRAELEVIEDA